MTSNSERLLLLRTICFSLGMLAFASDTYANRVILSYGIPITVDGVMPPVNHRQVQSPICNEHIECSSPVFDFGLAVGGQDVWVTYPINNRCEELVYIRAIFPCSGTFPNRELGPILPGQTVFLSLQIPTAPVATTVSRGITVYTRAEEPPILLMETYRLLRSIRRPLAAYKRETRFLKAYLLTRLST